MPEFYTSGKSGSTSRLEDAQAQPFGSHTVSNVTNNLWKAPENWEYTSLPVPPPKSSARPPWRPNSDESNLPGSEVFPLQKNLLRRMRTASPKIMLERLTEEWTDPTDATIEEELEFEKQLWMRTALHSFVQMGTTGEDPRGQNSAPKPLIALSETVKILSLYEDHGMFISCTQGFSTQSSQLVTKDLPPNSKKSIPCPLPHTSPNDIPST